MAFNMPAVPIQYEDEGGRREGFASGGLLKAAKRVASMFGGPGGDIEPRKGQGGVEAQTALSQLASSAGREKDAKQRRFVASPQILRQLADDDDIVFSIRRTLRNAIGEMGWRVVPDLDRVKDEIRRWESSVATRMAMPSLPIDFKPKALSSRIYQSATGPLYDLLVSLQEQGVKPTDFGSDHRYRAFFENIVTAHEAIAQSHVGHVEDFLKRPNPSAESSFRAFLNLLIDDVTLFDAGVIVKNQRADGSLGEIYTIPGEQVEIYRAADRSTPQPPEPAYRWVEDGRIKALFNNLELVYVMANPQNTGYGMSPVEVILRGMIGAAFADMYLVDWFSKSNMPFFVFDLGPNVQAEERDAAQEAWDRRVAGGRHRGIFVANKEGVKGFLPMQTQSNRDADVMAQLKFWANRKCAAFGLSLNDIGFTEDLHRTTAETQAELTQSRGVSSFANNIEGYVNGEIVHGWMWVRDDPDNPAGTAGHVARCFPWDDVKFEFFTDETTERLGKANSMIPGVVAGIYKPNEARKEAGLPPEVGGDELVNWQAGGVKVRDYPDIPGPGEQQQLAVGSGEGEGGDNPGDDRPAQLGGDVNGSGAPLALGKGLPNAPIARLMGLAERLNDLVSGKWRQ